MTNKKVTAIQLAVLRALQPGETFDPDFRPRSSLERLHKKGLVSGNRKRGWTLTREGAWYLDRLDKA